MLLTNAIQTIVTISQVILSNVVDALRVSSARPAMFAEPKEAMRLAHWMWPAWSRGDAHEMQKRSNLHPRRYSPDRLCDGRTSVGSLCCGRS